jgi:hypothetical protein
MKTIWGTHKLAGGKILKFHLGDLYLWLRYDSLELRVAHTYHKEVNMADALWTRWIINEQPVVINLYPLMPDRSIIVKPENSFNLLAGSRVQIYVKIPLWIGVQVGNKTLVEIPSVILSNTWFGNFFEGELCYWISTGARLKLNRVKQKNYLAIAPVQLINNSDDDLPVEQLCLQVPNLTLFIDQDTIWTDDLEISFKGLNTGSELKLSNKAPKESQSAKRISKARKKEKSGLKAKAFSSLKDLPGIGNFIS